MTEWLFDTMVATSMLMLAVLLLREPVRRRFGASVAYAMWLIPAARLVMPTLTTTVERTIPAAEPAGGAAPLLGQPMLHAATIASEPSLIEQLGGWQSVAMAAWLAGAAAMLVRAAFIYSRQRRAVLGDAVQIARLDGIRMVRSGAVGGPLAFGIFDRVIAVPIDFEERFSPVQRRLALDHELAHHRSGDLVANHFAFGLLCLQWFNPLAWLSHSAFRFDQEAACDARVLDKAQAGDREAYGQAIAKAASGRALLFAGALDRPSTLQRRLKSMLNVSNPRRQSAGKALIVLGIAFALPLTASWATRYVDTPAPTPPTPPAAAGSPSAPTPPTAPVAPVAPLAGLAGLVAPTPPTPPAPPAPPRVPDIGMIGKDTVQIHGKTRRWEDLTPAERAEIRAEIRSARQEIAKSRVTMERDIAQARQEMTKFKNGEFKREMANARIDIENALREIDANADDIRRAGQNVEQMKATVRASLEEVQKMDIEKIQREALASLDERAIRGAIEEAQRSIDEVEANLDRKAPKSRK